LLDGNQIMKNRRCPIAAALIALIACPSAATQEHTVRIAAAADLKFAMVELAQKFQEQTGAKVDVTYGSSGNFFSQIRNGAPFDLFFSADVEYPRKLADSGVADPATLYEYAVGRIVIWTPPEARLDVTRDTWKVLLDPSVQKVAIANPEHAPYGRAAVAAMQKAGVYEQVKPKLVFGENISQAAQFVQSGSAQAGIIALSLALSPPMRDGKYWVIPADMHPLIAQGAVLLRSAKNKNGATAFLSFVRSPAGREILSRFGFQFPSPGRN
jgi:molybdate transport system substrate-binding protein